MPLVVESDVKKKISSTLTFYMIGDIRSNNVPGELREFNPSRPFLSPMLFDIN